MVELCKNWSEWLTGTRFSYMREEQKAQTMRWLAAVRDAVLLNADVKQGDRVIDIGTGTGLLAFRVLEILNGSGEIIFSDKFQDCLTSCEEFLSKSGVNKGFSTLLSPAEHIGLTDNSVDKALMRSVLVHILDKQAAISEVYRILKKGGTFAAFEPIISSNTRYWELVSAETVENYDKFKSAENEFMSSKDEPLTNFDEQSLAQNLDSAGFSDGRIDIQVVESKYVVDKKMVETWLNTPPSPDRATMKGRFMEYFSQKDVDKYILDLQNALDGSEVTTKSNAAFITAIK